MDNIMNDENQKDGFIDRRSDERRPPDKYYSVQFSVKDLGYYYQFKIWDVSSKGMCILIGEDSTVMGYLKVGDVINMQYYLSDSVGTTEEFKTEINHITKNDEGRFKGHYLVGLSILNSGREYCPA